MKKIDFDFRIRATKENSEEIKELANRYNLNDYYHYEFSDYDTYYYYDSEKGYFQGTGFSISKILSVEEFRNLLEQPVNEYKTIDTKYNINKAIQATLTVTKLKSKKNKIKVGHLK